MRALLIGALFFSLSLFACSGDFALCKQKFNDAGVAQNGSLAVPIAGSNLLIYTPNTPQADIERANPFLGLYIVKSSDPFPFPFTLTGAKPAKTIAVDGYIALPGKVVEGQKGLNRLGRFEHPLADPALLMDACCALEGVITRRGVIEKSYLEHFLQSKGSTVYGDAGIRIEPDGPGAEVESVDPFFKANPLRPGDRIRAFDGVAVRNGEALMKQILFGAPGSVHTMEVERSGQRLQCSVTLQQRKGGGLVSDTYLERFGLRFDREMRVLKVGSDPAVSGVMPGDRLLQVNTQMVEFDDDVRAALAEQEERASLLFERDGFQFFVDIPFGDSKKF